MNKKIIVMTLFIFIMLFLNTKNVYAISSSDYENRELCAGFEVDGVHSDGEIITIKCFGTYEESRDFMKAHGQPDVVVMTKVNGKTKIVDANAALLDLSVNKETLTYFYNNSDLTSNSYYTYMDTGSLYGGVDGVHLDSSYSNLQHSWTAKVKIGNYTGWIKQDAYEIVPLPWIKSKSSYTVSNESIRHNYVAKIQNNYNGGAGSTIGPKPDMLSVGTYYSYDGHYFYKDLETLIKDYKNSSYDNSVNKDNAYYNYYMYLSNHTKTTYSSINIDEYIRNNLGISRDIYGNSTVNGSSRLYGSGTYFYYAQQKYGVNAILSLSLSRNETGNGRSSLAAQKNNGFGLNAVDSNPYQAANWYANFANSILGYASKWITNGYAHPRDSRYFGPQFGDKFIGMNVSYASDTYWSEKMAANYYSFDKAKGLQDYNYYQLGVNTRWGAPTYSSPNTQSRIIYKYPEPEDAVVIVSERTGTTVEGSNKWYEIVSDLNIDNNYNEINGDYNWNATVFIPAAYIKKINNGKNGYISPNEVTNYQDSEYSYDLLVDNSSFNPKVGISTKKTDFYYDSSLQSRKNQVLHNNRYVIIYSIAYNKEGNPVSYLVTSNYWYNEKHWVSADAITIVNKAYGKENVTVDGNQYSWVNSITEDTASTVISGLYTNSYVPILEQRTVNGVLWYKVPVDISNTTNEFGWTLAQDNGVKIDVYGRIEQDSFPSIVTSNKTIIQGRDINILDGVTASDIEDGNLTSKVKVRESNLDINKVGVYKVVYEVVDSFGQITTKDINITVTENKKPVIEVEKDTIETIQGRKVKISYKAKDNEDGDITSKVEKIKDNVDFNTPGEYEIIYSVTDSFNQTTTKMIKVIVIKDENPVITANDLILTKNDKFNVLDNVSCIDKEDGDLTNKIKVKENNININVSGIYHVTYEVTDSNDNTSTLTINVEVVENIAPVIKAYDKKITIGTQFNELKDVVATDYEDGDLTNKIKVVENTVNTKKAGIYKVVYEVEDSKGEVTTLLVKVEVIEEVYEQVDGNFYFNYLKEVNGKLKLQGYQTILGINNTLDNDITYKLVLENINTGLETIINATRITDSIPKKVYSRDGLDYTFSWFNAIIDINQLDLGNYKMYVIATNNMTYSKSLVTNKTYNEQATFIKTNKNNCLINNNYSTATSFVEIKVRDEVLNEKSSSYIYNQYDKYTNFSFTNDNKLHLRGNSYSYGMDLGVNSKVERNIIFEDTSSYKTYTKSLGSITTGNYKVVLPEDDKLDKTRSWYDTSIDISDIPEGVYVIYISTKANINDIAELTEKLGRSLDNVEKTINNKKYSFIINKARGNRVEMIVTK